MDVKISKLELLKSIILDNAEESTNKSDIAQLYDDLAEELSELDDMISVCNESSINNDKVEFEKNLIRVRSAMMCLESHFREASDVLSDIIVDS